MAKQSNFANVVRFEYTRTANKPTFWLATLFVPIMMIAIALVSGLSSIGASQAQEEQAKAPLAFEYVDASGLVSPELAEAFGGTVAESQDAAVDAVRSGDLEAFFAFPADPAAEPVQVWGQDVGLFANSKYSSIATGLLQQSAVQQVGSAQLASILSGDVNTETVTYRDGEATGGFESIIPGFIFLILFYVILILLGNQALSSTVEEKENRVTEMILTTIRPTSFISGKIVALVLIGLTQMLVFATPIVVGYLWFKDSLGLPDLGSLAIQTNTLIVGTLVLLTGVAMLISLLAGLGAAMPSVKDAGPLFTAVIITLFLPAYVFSLVMSDPNAVIVQFFLFFPITAPVTALMLNAFGTLAVWQAIVVILELAVFAILLFRFAIELFKLGSIQYTSKVSLRSVFGAVRKTNAKQ